MAYPTSPANHWTFGSGTAAAGGINLSVGAGVTFDATGGPFGGPCAVFPGVNTAFLKTLSTSGNFALTADRTLLIWAKWNALTGTGIVASAGDGFSTTHWGFTNAGNTTLIAEVFAGGTTGFLRPSVPNVTRGPLDWHLLCVRYRHADRLYEIKVDDRLPFGYLEPLAFDSAAAFLSFGAQGDGGAPLNARLAEALLYTRWVPDADIDAYYRTLPGYVVQPAQSVPILTPSSTSGLWRGATTTVTGPHPDVVQTGDCDFIITRDGDGDGILDYVQISVDGEYLTGSNFFGYDIHRARTVAVTTGRLYQFRLDTTQFRDGNHVFSAACFNQATGGYPVAAVRWPFRTQNGAAVHDIRPRTQPVAEIGVPGALAWDAWCCDGTREATADPFVDNTVTEVSPYAATADKITTACVKPRNENADEASMTAAAVTLTGPAGAFLETGALRFKSQNDYRVVPVIPAHPTGFPHLCTDGGVRTAYTPGLSRFARWMFNVNDSNIETDPGLLAAVQSAGLTAVEVPFLVTFAGGDWSGALEPWLSTELARIEEVTGRLAGYGLGVLLIGDTLFRYPASVMALRDWAHGATALAAIAQAWRDSGVVHGANLVDETGFAVGPEQFVPGSDYDWAIDILRANGFPAAAFTCIPRPYCGNANESPIGPGGELYGGPDWSQYLMIGMSNAMYPDCTQQVDGHILATRYAVRRAYPGTPWLVNTAATRNPLVDDASPTPSYRHQDHSLAQIGAAIALGCCGVNVYGYDHTPWRSSRIMGGGQWGAYPGDEVWAAVVSAFAAIARFEREFLQPPVSSPNWGPNWLTGRRLGQGHDTIIAVNALDVPQALAPSALADAAAYAAGTVVTATGMTEFAPGFAVTVPAGGWVVLTGTPTTTTPAPVTTTVAPSPLSRVYLAGDTWTVVIPLPYDCTAVPFSVRLLTAAGGLRVMRLFTELTADGRVMVITAPAAATASLFSGVYALRVTRSDNGALIANYPLTVDR